MINFDLTESSFDKRNTLNYELFVHISTDSLSFMVVDTSQNILSIRKHDFPESKEGMALSSQIESIVLKDIFLQNSYRKVKVSIFNRKNTLIPSRLYNEEEKHVYLANITKVEDRDSLFSDELKFANAQNVYAISNDVLKVIHSYFSGAKIIHSSSSLLKQFHLLAKSDNQQVYINVGHDFFQEFFFQEGELIFYNSFPYTSSKDFIYHVLLIFDQFHLKQDEVSVFLTGEIMEDSEIYHLIYRYIRRLTILSPPEELVFSEQWENRPKHWFFDLYSLMKMN